MYLLAQHGWGKGEKIEKGIRDNSLHGVIFSPKDEKKHTFEDYVSRLCQSQQDLKVILDPQFYHTTFQNSKDGNLDDYPFYDGYHGISAFRGSKNLRGFTQNVLEYQETLPFTYLTSPTIYLNSFGSREAQVVLNFANESIDVKTDNNFQKPLLLSLVIHENAFLDKRSMEDFLDELSMMDAHGIYLVISRNTSGYHQSFDDATKLANIMAFIYSLSIINDMKVTVGYSDLLGLIYLSVGAHQIATGWSQSLRRFTTERVAPLQTGGRRPRQRYTSAPLLNSILLSELDSIWSSSLNRSYRQFLSGTTYDSFVSSDPINATWDDSTSTLHHWSSLENTAKRLFDHCSDVSERLDSLMDAISTARGLYTLLDAAHIQFDRKSDGSHLDVWSSAINEFRLEAGL